MVDDGMPQAPALPPFLYHGTSRLYLDQILRDGLLPCTMTGEEDMTCLADDPEIAIHHAMCQAEFEEADPVVFAIPISCFDPAFFRLEDNFVRLGPSAGRGVALNHAMSEKEWVSLPWTWQGMLKDCGAVGYTAPVPVTAEMMAEGRDEDELRSAILRLREGCEAFEPGLAA